MARLIPNNRAAAVRLPFVFSRVAPAGPAHQGVYLPRTAGKQVESEDLRREILRVDDRPLTANDCKLDGVLQLPHVAWPEVGHQEP